MKVKRQIAHLLANRTTFDYELNLEFIYNNRYTCIDKAPIKMLFEACLTIPNSTIELIKEVIIEALEYGGIEQTFADEDWGNFQFLPHPEEKYAKWGYTVLNTKKGYMCEFFE